MSKKKLQVQYLSMLMRGLTVVCLFSQSLNNVLVFLRLSLHTLPNSAKPSVQNVILKKVYVGLSAPDMEFSLG